MKITIIITAILCLILIVSGNTQAENYRFSESALREASHNAVQRDCGCSIKEWLPETFDYESESGNYYGTLEVFSSRKTGDYWFYDLAAFVMIQFNPKTGDYRIVEVDYYNPNICKNYDY